jgi:hypothetical protein
MVNDTFRHVFPYINNNYKGFNMENTDFGIEIRPPSAQFHIVSMSLVVL